jgi:mevalonate kinase
MSHRLQAETSTTTGTAPARVCLGGEDLDWIGGPALLTAIESRIEVTYDKRAAARTLVISAEGALRARLTLPRSGWLNPTDSELELIRLCWQHAAQPPMGGRISIQTAAPTSAGLASSATACVAALRAFLPAPGMTPEQLIHTAYDIEHNIAGRPVGPMDFVPASVGGTTLIGSASETITDISHLDLPPDARFVVVDTRTPRDTGAVIAWKRARLEAGERGIRLYADRMPELVEEQARILRAGGDLEGLGQTLNEAQALLCHQMKVSTPLIDTCADRLRASGALGVKLTGTGLGGCLFALTTANADTERLTRSIGDLPVSAHLIRPAERTTTR